MKVLQINAVYGFGSTGTIAESLYELTKQNNIDAYVAYQRTNKDVSNGYQVGNILDWKLHALLARITGKQGFYSSAATRRLLRWCDSIRPDIIHVHNLHSNYINWPMLCDYCAQKKIALILTLHDCWFFTGKCTHFVRTNCDRWMENCGNCSQLKLEVPSLFADNTSCVLQKKRACYDKIEKLYVVGCSKWISTLAGKSILKNKNITTIRNGIDTGVFTDSGRETAKMLFGLEKRFVILGFADKWFDEKNRPGVKTVLNGLDQDTAVLIVGCSAAQVEQYQDDKRMRTLPYIKEKEKLANVYRAADVFVNLTHADTLPTVNMESICCGTPVVTFDCGGSPELIDADAGVVVAENDFEGVLGAIRQIQNGGCRFSAPEKAEKFEKNRCFEEYIALYREVGESDLRQS